ncbi:MULTISPECIES: hypothetical protein [unclassified Mesorhizobium]|uniref:hypothetical protein n=1 Tax=unclassified Mesorhizobium TaxID=325217 RepID=UPI001CCEDBF8|nr:MULTISPECIES: hypothetical protein [unclassified Mesorhizobium]MBZ9683871.1 hypothetical protein [Mesorhizobium sp. CO1-1-2]MBZ9696607.1 hypothetical protein [Mesorhizobium sp. CO1-1-9]MBZ9725402.1 hypothetical protein [Mesorhizobium sp. CO1-1-11]MBZ9923663.1 hypothetical protein [Mesorhizobium sp. BR1-1-4]
MVIDDLLGQEGTEIRRSVPISDERHIKSLRDGAARGRVNSELSHAATDNQAVNLELSNPVG